MIKYLLFILTVMSGYSAFAGEISNFDGEAARILESNSLTVAEYTTRLAKNTVARYDYKEQENISVIAIPVSDIVVENNIEKVPVLRTNITRGQVIQDSDLDYIDPPRNLSSQYILNRNELVGKISGRPLQSGRPLRFSDVRSPTIVSKGNNAEISYITNTMELKDLGEVMQDGGVGDIVSVRNLKSGKTVQARVEKDGSLSVRTTMRNNSNQAMIPDGGEPRL